MTPRSGVVRMKLPDDKHCVIDYEDSGRSYSAFCIPRYCIADEIGQVQDIFVNGQVVSFDLKMRSHRGKLQQIADNVIPFFREQFIGDINAYGEASTLDRWIIEARNGFLRRANGFDVIYFESEPRNSYHRENMARLQIGDYVYHGVAPRLTNDQERDKFIATNLVFYSDAEQERFKRGDFRTDAELESIVESASVPAQTFEFELLSPKLKSLSLLEIMEKRKCERNCNV
jgi:hypothetical protein